jgi:hypothetical protein
LIHCRHRTKFTFLDLQKNHALVNSESNSGDYAEILHQYEFLKEHDIAYNPGVAETFPM